MAPKLLEKALKSVGGLEGFRQEREEFNRDLAFINENRTKLLEDYEESWVAVYEARVVAHGRDYNKVLFKLERANMPVEQIPIRYLSKQKVFALYPR